MNYLQVTAVAISINVDWTSAIIALFRAAREPSRLQNLSESCVQSSREV